MDFYTVWFPLHYSCNNKCSWCYAPAESVVGKEKRFTDEKEKDFVNLTSELGVKKIILIGGEPTIYPNLERLISRIVDKGMHTAVVTNGRRLSDKNYLGSLVDAGLNSVTISIEGSKPEIHDNTTQIPGSFYETINGLENALESGIPVATETTMSKDNMDYLEDIVTFLEGFDLSARLFNICGPCLSDLQGSDFALNPNKGAKLFENVYKTAKKKNVRLVTPIPICSFDQELYQEMRENKAVSHGCHILFGFNFVLDSNGDVLPCVHFTNYPIFNVFENGNVMSAEKFREEYENPEKVNQRFRDKIRRYPSTKCAEGDCWDPCTGGCSVFWLKYNAQEEIKGILSK